MEVFPSCGGANRSKSAINSPRDEILVSPSRVRTTISNSPRSGAVGTRRMLPGSAPSNSRSSETVLAKVSNRGQKLHLRLAGVARRELKVTDEIVFAGRPPRRESEQIEQIPDLRRVYLHWRRGQEDERPGFFLQVRHETKQPAGSGHLLAATQATAGGRGGLRRGP